MKKIFLLFLVGVSFLFFSCKKDSINTDPVYADGLPPVAVTKTNKTTKVWAHFMVWFETPQAVGGNGKWGYHWVRDTGLTPTFNAAIDTTGNLTSPWTGIAAHYTPLTGPYASNDMNILEYQLLLMKYSGIDGVLVDWYGISDMGTAEDKTANMAALFREIQAAGLELGVVYEDQFALGTTRFTATPLAPITSATMDSVTTVVTGDMNYLGAQYFSQSAYSKVNGQPLLLCFGPQTLKQWPGLTSSAPRWAQAFSGLDVKPCFVPLIAHSAAVNGTVNGVTYTNSAGEFMWVNNDILQNQYTRLQNNAMYIAGAWPGYNDYYGTGGASSIIPTDPQNGALLASQLSLATANKAKYLQLVTWNDYGEGTMIEPTYEYRYTFLQQVQAFTGVSYTASDLKNIKRLYDLRVSMASNASAQQQLNTAFVYFRSLQTDKAVAILHSLDGK
jgi:hypothetical protein